LGQIPASTVYRLGSEQSSSFDLLTGKVNEVPSSLRSGGKCHQLLVILFRDFYRPLPVAELFSHLFQGEHFNILSSPYRVRQIVFRLRNWLREEHLPIQILEEDGQYRALCRDDFSVLVPLEQPEVEGYHLHLDQLMRTFNNQPFTARKARAQLKMSLTSFNRFTKWALEKKRINRFGQGRATKYCIQSRPCQKKDLSDAA
jgi:hypothetical protein